MAKRYIFSREDIQNLIHNSMEFFSDKARYCMEVGKVPMFSDRVKWIEEFLDKHLREFPIDKLLDKVEEQITSFTGKSLDEIKDDLRKKNISVEEGLKKQKEIKEYMDNLG